MTTQAERIAAAVKASMLTEGGYTRQKAIKAIDELKINSSKGKPINASIAYHHICNTKKWGIAYIETDTPRAKKTPGVKMDDFAFGDAPEAETVEADPAVSTLVVEGTEGVQIAA